MRSLILTGALLTGLAASAHAQTAGTTFPNNQDASNTPAEQSMQQVGGTGGKNIAVVVQHKVRPAPTPAKTHHRRTVVKTRTSGPAASPAGAPK